MDRSCRCISYPPEVTNNKDRLNIYRGNECQDTIFSDQIITQMFYNLRTLLGRERRVPQPVPICLNGYKYIAIENLGTGEEGTIFGIEDNIGSKYALKIYHRNYWGRQKGDLLAQTKIKAARNLVSIPLMVNQELHYSVFEYLYYPWSKLQHEHAKMDVMSAFTRLLNPLLAQDNLRLGDNLNSGNYVVDSPKAFADLIHTGELTVIPVIREGDSMFSLSSGKMKRIDFGYLEEI